MSARAVAPEPSRHPAALVAGCWLLGMLVTFHPTFTSGFARIQGWPDQDPRLINFQLEHAYRWLSRDGTDLWSPPVFFPLKGVTTYSDPLLTTAPFYAPWRIVGLEPATAFQMWLLTVWTLNYAIGIVLLRRSFRTSLSAASVGAFVFAFGSSRVANLTKPQLIPYLFLTLALIAVIEVFRERDDAEKQRSADWGWVALFFAALVAQFYNAFYPLFFFCLALLAAFAWAICLPSLRGPTLKALRRSALPIASCAAVAGVIAWPLGVRYLTTSREVGLRIYDPTKITQWFSWTLMGSANWMYGWIDTLPRFRPWSRSIHTNGLGLVTSLIAAIGLYRARRRPAVVLLVLASATLFVVSLRLYGDLSFWQIIRAVVPGGGALRAVARIGALLVFPVSIGVALFFDQQAGRTSAVLLVALALFCFAEQAHREMSFDKEFLRWRMDRIEAQIPPGCPAFFLVSRGGYSDVDVHDDAMWIALRTGIPTVNGRYGNEPPQWDLMDSHIKTPDERAGIEQRFDTWLQVNHLTRADVCWVEIDRSEEQAAWREHERLLGRSGATRASQ